MSFLTRTLVPELKLMVLLGFILAWLFNWKAKKIECCNLTFCKPCIIKQSLRNPRGEEKKIQKVVKNVPNGNKWVNVFIFISFVTDLQLLIAFLWFHMLIYFKFQFKSVTGDQNKLI